MQRSSAWNPSNTQFWKTADKQSKKNNMYSDCLMKSLFRSHELMASQEQFLNSRWTPSTFCRHRWDFELNLSSFSCLSSFQGGRSSEPNSDLLRGRWSLIASKLENHKDIARDLVGREFAHDLWNQDLRSSTLNKLLLDPHWQISELESLFLFCQTFSISGAEVGKSEKFKLRRKTESQKLTQTFQTPAGHGAVFPSLWGFRSSWDKHGMYKPYDPENTMVAA